MADTAPEIVIRCARCQRPRRDDLVRDVRGTDGEPVASVRVTTTTPCPVCGATVADIERRP